MAQQREHRAGHDITNITLFLRLGISSTSAVLDTQDQPVCLITLLYCATHQTPPYDMDLVVFLHVAMAHFVTQRTHVRLAVKQFSGVTSTIQRALSLIAAKHPTEAAVGVTSNVLK